MYSSRKKSLISIFTTFPLTRDTKDISKWSTLAKSMYFLVQKKAVMPKKTNLRLGRVFYFLIFSFDAHI